MKERNPMANELMINPKLDLVFERLTPLSIEQMWKGWTHPETLMKWFCPRPWRVSECHIDLRAGGRFFTEMRGPEGQIMPNEGCYLEVIKNEKLVWTNMMTGGFCPSLVNHPGFPFVAMILFSKSENGNLYRAIVRHADEAGLRMHEQMGFQEGWGRAFEQLVELK